MTEHDEGTHPGGEPDAAPPAAPETESPRLTRREARAARARKRRPVLKAIVVVLVVLLVAVLSGFAYLWYHFNGNLKTLDVQKGLLHPDANATTDPTSGQMAMNILVMGVDSRAGSDSAYGNAEDARSGERSDTTMLVHLAADRQSAIVVSIPRDAMMPAPPRKGEQLPSSQVDVKPTASTGQAPGCVIDAPASQWKLRQFNSNIQDGGVECAIATVEHDTGLPIDHAMTVDFSGFKEIVNAMGTVPICITKPVKDDLSGLDLTAGRHDLNGDQALAFVRTRHGIGDGSDLGRMRLQQDFAASVVRKATSTGVLLNPGKLYGVMDAATKALKPDAGLNSMSALTGLANQLRDLKPANVHLLTAPTQAYPRDPNRLELAPAATQLWAMIRQDQPWGSSTSSSSASASPTTSAATVAPSSVTVAIQNASGTNGLGTQAAAVLRAQGFTVAAVTPAGSVRDGVVVHHTAAQLAQAQELAQAFPGATLAEDGSAGQPVTVTIGRGAQPLVAVPNRQGSGALPSQPLTAPTVPAASASPSLTAKAASDDVCSDTSKGQG